MKFQAILKAAKAKSLKNLLSIVLKISNNKKSGELKVSLIYISSEQNDSQIRLFIENDECPIVLIIYPNQVMESINVANDYEDKGIVLIFKEGRYFLEQLQKIIQNSTDIITMNIKRQKPLLQNQQPFRCLKVQSNFHTYKFQIFKPGSIYSQPSITQHQWFNGLSKCRLAFNVSAQQIKDMLRMIIKCRRNQLMQTQTNSVQGSINPKQGTLTMNFQTQYSSSFTILSKIQVIRQPEFTDKRFQEKIHYFEIKIQNAKKVFDTLDFSQVRIYVSESNQVGFIFSQENVYLSHIRMTNLFRINGNSTKFEQ